MKIKLYLLVLATTLLLCDVAFSKEDKNGGVDHPLLTRPPGTYIDDYNYANYDQAQIIGSTLENKKNFELINVEGKISQIEYRIKDEQLSVSQLFSNYKKALNNLNAEFIVDCIGETECGATAQKFHNKAARYSTLFGGDRIAFGKNFAILTAKFEQSGQTSHVMIVASKTKDNHKIFQSIVSDNELIDNQINIGSIDGRPKNTIKTGTKKDKNGGVDHPLLTRYPGTYIDNFSYTDFDQAQMISSNLKNKKSFDLVNIEGKVSQIEYRINDRTLSAFQVISNYKKALSNLNAKFIVTCLSETECGATSQKFHNKASRYSTLFSGDRIDFGRKFGLITAIIEQNEQTAHVMIIASEYKNNHKIFQSIVSGDKTINTQKETSNTVVAPKLLPNNTIETNGDGLSQADIDKLILTAPTILKAMDQATQSLTENEQIRTSINDALFNGNPYQVYPEVLANEKEAWSKIEKSALENKYNSYIEFAKIADRVYSVITVNSFMTTSASIGKPKKIKNVFEYIELDSTPSDEKTRLTGYLPNMYQKLNTNSADVPIVSKNFDKLHPIFRK